MWYHIPIPLFSLFGSLAAIGFVDGFFMLGAVAVDVSLAKAGNCRYGGGGRLAAFTAAILSGKPVPDAHKQAVGVSAYVCTQSGAMPEALKNGLK